VQDKLDTVETVVNTSVGGRTVSRIVAVTDVTIATTNKCLNYSTRPRPGGVGASRNCVPGSGDHRWLAVTPRIASSNFPLKILEEELELAFRRSENGGVGLIGKQRNRCGHHSRVIPRIMDKAVPTQDRPMSRPLWRDGPSPRWKLGRGIFSTKQTAGRPLS